jgi:hypothetical protein
MHLDLTAKVVLVGLCLIVAGVAQSAVSNVYWRVDLHQGSYIIAYGQGSTEALAWDDCFRLQAITRAMTAAETRRNAVAAITTSAVRWCQNPKRYATVSPDPVAPTPVNCVVSEWGAWSDPAWLACVDGMQSRSIVRTRTILTQPANGGAACPSLVETQAQTRVCPGTAILGWDHTVPPSIAGFRVVHGVDPNALISTIQIANPSLRRYIATGLPAGHRCFGVKAYDATEVESPLSTVTCKDVL